MSLAETTPQRSALFYPLQTSMHYTDDDAEMLIQALVSCRLDYCNALLYDISDGLISAAAVGAKRSSAARHWSSSARSHHARLPRQLHWRPVRQRIDFKLAVMVHKSLHGLTPSYLSEDCQVVTEVGRRHLRSADVHTCVYSSSDTVTDR